MSERRNGENMQPKIKFTPEEREFLLAEEKKALVRRIIDSVNEEGFNISPDEAKKIVEQGEELDKVEKEKLSDPK